MGRLNLKLTGSLALSAIVIIAGVHFLHAYQVSQNAGMLLTQAKRAKEEGKPQVAMERFAQYLRQRDDADTYAQLCDLVAKDALGPNASRQSVFRGYRTLDEALRRHPELDSVRRQLADLLLLKLGRIGDAARHYDELRRSNRQDTQLDMRYAQCEIALAHEDKALRLLYELVGFNDTTQKFDLKTPRGPQELDAYVILGDLLRRRFDAPAKADAMMEQMVKANPKNARAYLFHARYQQRNQMGKEMAVSIKRALALAPDDADVILAAAEIAIAKREFSEAAALLARGVKLYPENESMYRTMAAMAMAEGKSDEALARVEEGLKVIPNSQAMRLFLADLQLQRRDLVGLRKSLKTLDAVGLRHDLIEYLHARALVVEGKWLQASRRLEQIRPLLADLPDMIQQIDLHLALCYEKLGEPDQELEVYRKALLRDPTLVPAIIGEARALTALGKQQAAIELLVELDRALSRSGAAAALSTVRNQLLQLRINEQLSRPEGARDWTVVDALMKQYDEDPTLTPAQKAIVHAELRLMQDHVDEAVEILMQARSENPKDLAVWLALLNLMQRSKNPERTQKFVDLARKELGDIVPLRIAQATVWAQADSQMAVKQFPKLEKDLDKFSEDQQAAFWGDLGNLYYRLRDYAGARRCWTKLAAARAEDPQIQQTLFDLAVEFNDPDAIASSTEDLRRLVGAQSSLYKYAQASQIVWQVRNKKAELSSLQRARRLVSDAKLSRPEWYDLARLNAEIDELDGKVDNAIAGYERALELSPSHVGAARHLVELLYGRGRLAEANQFLAFVGQTSSTDGGMDRIRSDIRRRSGDVATALAIAEKAAADNPSDATNLTWYGQMLDAVGRTEDAEQQFREATQRAPASGQVWLMLENHLLLAKKKNAAAAVADDIKRSVGESERPMLLAQYYELMGDSGHAEKVYLGMLSEKSDDLAFLQTLAGFFVRTKQVDKAGKYLDEILDAGKVGADGRPVEQTVWARRVKAQLIKSKGDFESLQQAVKMLESNAIDGKIQPEDVGLIAAMLGERPEAQSRQRAVRMLEQLRNQQVLAPEQQFLLAQLYERSGKWHQARDQMLNLLGHSEDNVGYAAAFAQSLLRHNEADDAARWVDKVVRAQPRSQQAIELRTQLLVKQGQPEEAVKLVQSLLPDPLPPAQAGQLAALANLLESVGQFPPAEAMLRQYVTLEPRGMLVLAAFLARHGNLDEAFALFEKSRRSQPLATIVTVALSCLRTRPEEATERYYEHVEKWIQAGLSDESSRSALQMQWANLFDQRGQIDKVVELYHEVLSHGDFDSRQQAIVKNNLAFVLAWRHQTLAETQEARRLIDEAIQVMGPTSDLQDTMGIVYLAENDVERAINQFKQAVDEGGNSPKQFHLALAEYAGGNASAARKSLTYAIDLGLDSTQLSRQEQIRYQKLLKELGLTEPPQRVLPKDKL